MIEQAIYSGQGEGGYRFLARSLGFREEWLAEAERLCTGFGERPAGVTCPSCVFARPFARSRVAIVQVADRGRDDSGRPGALAFYLLILSRSLYHELGGDPFYLAEQYPPPWTTHGELPSLTLCSASPPRSVKTLQKILNVPHSATLLGGVQVLLDGGRLVFERLAPDAAPLRDLWALLPLRERCRLWPASFVFDNTHQFNAVVVPRAAGPEYEHYVREEKAGDYPEGRYECNLQSAIETGDQGEIDALLNYSRSRTLRLIVLLSAMVILLSAAMSVLLPRSTPLSSTPAVAHAPSPSLDLPPANEFRALDIRERGVFAARLHALGARHGIELPEEISDDHLADALAALDQRLGTPNPHRDPGRLRTYGPLQRQLRALLWKHDIAEYNDRRLNVMELLERLQSRLEEERHR